jgi:hypothetical protein
MLITTNPANAARSAGVSAQAMRIVDEFEKLPTMRLTSAQARRLWHLDEVQCEGIFAALVDVGYLRKTSLGQFVKSATW